MCFAHKLRTGRHCCRTDVTVASIYTRGQRRTLLFCIYHTLTKIPAQASKLDFAKKTVGEHRQVISKHLSAKQQITQFS